MIHFFFSIDIQYIFHYKILCTTLKQKQNMKTKFFKVIVLLLIVIRLFWFNKPVFHHPNLHELSIIILIAIASLILRSFTRKKLYNSITEKQKNYLIFIVSVILLIIIIFNPYYWINSIIPINWISIIIRVLTGLGGIIGLIISVFNLGMGYEDEE